MWFDNVDKPEVVKQPFNGSPPDLKDVRILQVLIQPGSSDLFLAVEFERMPANCHPRWRLQNLDALQLRITCYEVSNLTVAGDLSAAAGTVHGSVVLETHSINVTGRRGEFELSARFGRAWTKFHAYNRNEAQDANEWGWFKILY